LQVSRQFLAPAANGLGVQAGDFGDLPDTPMPAAQSLAAGDPTSLLFVEAAEDQIEVPMIILLGVLSSFTSRTRTLMNGNFPGQFPASLLGDGGSLPGFCKSRNRSCTGA
jgi:hypothetical protein